MSSTEQQQIIIYGASEEELMKVKGFIRQEMIRFSEQAVEFEFHDTPPRLIWVMACMRSSTRPRARFSSRSSLKKRR